MKFVHACIFAILCVSFIHPAWAQNKVLVADARMRPPEMVVDEKTGNSSGPLIEVLNEAASKLGYTVQWHPVPFARSLDQLKSGNTDIVPRLIMTEERKDFAEFLGPIGVQHAEIDFIVRSGKEHTLKSYQDLQAVTVAVKRKTVYFEQFDKDKSIRRMEATDDEQLAAMFNAKRFDVIIVLDKPAIERAFKEKSITDYAWADFKVPITMGVYFGMSKASKHAGIAAQLSNALREMVKSGRVAKIYKNSNVDAPPIK